MDRVSSSTATTSANRLVTLSRWMSGASGVDPPALTVALLPVPRAAHSVAHGGVLQGRTRENLSDSLYDPAYAIGDRGAFPPRCAARGPFDRRLLPRGGLRPDEQLRGHRGGAAAPGRPRGVHRRGVLRRDAR